jgi:hypothetical protein
MDQSPGFRSNLVYTLRLVRVGRDKRELMRKTGTLEKIGSQNIYETTRAAVVEAQRTAGEPQQA